MKYIIYLDPINSGTKKYTVEILFNIKMASTVYSKYTFSHLYLEDRNGYPKTKVL